MGPDLSASVAAAAEALAEGGVIVLPTDTVYGLAARLDSPAAAEMIYDLKGRPDDKALQVLVPDVSWLSRLAEPRAAATVLAEAFWPGALTIVVPDRGGATIGLRAPDHALAQAVLAAAGPLRATSANRSGEPTPHELSDIVELFGDGVAVYLDGGRIEGTASTVVEVVDDDIRVSREGSIATREIMRVLEGSI